MRRPIVTYIGAFVQIPRIHRWDLATLPWIELDPPRGVA
jgi:hypothetical protein